MRLYFVDAPETNPRYPERTREQAEYFGATLDQVMTVQRGQDRGLLLNLEFRAFPPYLEDAG